jgi:hypothetical protein
MPNKTWLTAMVALAFLAGIGGCLGYAFAGSLFSGPGHAKLPDGQVLQQDLATQDWVFEPVDAAQIHALGITQPVLTKNQAIDRVYKQSPMLAQAKDVFGVTANLARLSMPSLQQSAQAGVAVDPTFLKPRLVWIVTLGGLSSQSVGPPGSTPAVSNELDVVLDALTGDQLMSFVWTR